MGDNGERIIYAATRGCYSDYHVVCLFTRREDAEQYVNDGGGDEIEEMSLFDRPVERVTVYSAYWHPGKPFWVDSSSMDAEQAARFRRPEVHEVPHLQEEWRRNGKLLGYHWVVVRALSKEDALKALRDRTAIIGVREGLPNAREENP